ncbi:uncharacterized protein LOC136071237 [Quercus suber]|uniref:uncharacterized protein LOC136071237 n=1 Tax=Quercus suber TaxID=58331 RepID=UPI0032DFA661
MGSDKFLGYIITHRGIEVDPDQIKAIRDLKPPQNPKEVQKLTRMIAALNRFISRSADQCRPFYLLINKWKGFEWSEDCVMAFQQLKEYLSRPPIMSHPEANEVLYAYIAVALHTVSLSVIEKSLRLRFSTINNEAEYEALLQGMVMVQKMGGKAVEMFSDSRLVVDQVKGELEARDSRMQKYLSQVKRLQPGFDLFSLSNVSRSGNTHADSSATLATSSARDMPRIFLWSIWSKQMKW